MCVFVCLNIYTHTNTMAYYSAIKKNEIIPFSATWMDLEIIILSEVSKKKKQIPYQLQVESKIRHR